LHAFGLLRNELGLQILSLYAGFLHIWLSSKRLGIADLVALRRTCAWLTSRRPWIEMLSLYAGLPCIWLTSKRLWITAFVAMRRTWAHLAYFETTLDCRFCCYTEDLRAFGLLRNDLVLQIVSLYAGLARIWLTSKRPRIADVFAIRRTCAHLAYFETSLDCRSCRYT
jgi:hypothetical protein